MLDLNRMALVLPDVIANLETLQDRLCDRDAAQAPETFAQAADAVRALITLLGTSQGGLARELGGINEKTVRDWCAAKGSPGPLAVRAMRLLAERLVAPPASDLVMSTNRTAPCAEALGPHLVALLGRAEAVGWQREEAIAAVAAWSKATTLQS
jgi:DNA-binding transcriptional regulator YiaG